MPSSRAAGTDGAVLLATGDAEGYAVGPAEAARGATARAEVQVRAKVMRRRRVLALVSIG